MKTQTSLALHPASTDFLQVLHQLVPDVLAGLLGGLAAASAALYTEGGLMVHEFALGEAIRWEPTTPASDVDVLEFFARAVGCNHPQTHHRCDLIRIQMDEALKLAYPDSTIHMEVELDDYSAQLHVLVCRGLERVAYLSLFWSID